MELLTIGQPGGTYEDTGNIIKDILDVGTLKYMDTFATALSYSQNKESVIIYTNWDAISSPHPDEFIMWLIKSYDSILAFPNRNISDLLSGSYSIGTYQHPSRVWILEKQLKAMGIVDPIIKRFNCFSSMKKALMTRDIDFVYGNSTNIYKSIGALELLTTRIDPDVPHFDTLIDNDLLSNTSTRFGIIGKNIDISSIRSLLLSQLTSDRFDIIGERGYNMDISSDHTLATGILDWIE